MQMLGDLPYLEPLWKWLREDSTLKSQFTDKSFFMPHHELVSAALEAAKKDCPMPRSIWIIPGDTVSATEKPGCAAIGLHDFSVVIFVQCIRDAFQISKNGDDYSLKGQFMEMIELRRLVKQSIRNFSKAAEANFINRKYEGLRWVGDANLYPTDEMKMLAVEIRYQVRLNP